MTISKSIKAALAGLVLAGAGILRADDLAARVIILANAREPDSVALAEFYAAQRGVPLANLIALPMPEAESISWREFIDQIYQPLQDELFRRGWIVGSDSSLLDRFGRKRYGFIGHNISYLVTVRGVPLSIYNDPALLQPDPEKKISDQFYTNRGAVDSELSLLSQSGYEITSLVANPLYANELPSAIEEGMVVKVSRLDGPTFADARQLVISALAGEKQGLAGRYYIDLNGPTPHPDGDKWLNQDRAILDGLGFDGDVESTGATFGAAARFDAPVLYFGWYAANLNGPFANPGFKFPPGAVAAHIHSTSAQTLHSDSSFWCGPFVARGVTATVGNVGEPYLQMTHRLDLLLRALSRGETFGDAAYYAVPELSWEAIAIGDPLYRPFKISLEEQERHLADLPPDLAPYVILRRANLMWRQGRKDEALVHLRQGLDKYPGLVLALALANRTLAHGDAAGAVTILRQSALAVPPRPADWPLVRQAAEFLADQKAGDAAVAVYASLVPMAAPTPQARIAMLTEAHAAAKQAKDRVHTRDFGRLLREAQAQK